MNPENNPFAYRSPEQMSAEEVVDLFVDVFTDFYKVREPGHTMVRGPRGCGKSMMFRFLEPDCQRVKTESDLRSLDFLAVLVSIKNTGLNVTELTALPAGGVATILNEHLLTMYITAQMFGRLRVAAADLSDPTFLAAALNYREKTFVRLMKEAGATPEQLDLGSSESVAEVFESLETYSDSVFTKAIRQIKHAVLQGKEVRSIEGPLCGYFDFFLPLCKRLRELPFLPKGPIYLLVDDADNLNRLQTEILNTWIASRTSQTVSVKVSTQLKYRTFRTIGGQTIEAPHDYSEVNVIDLYTTSVGRYRSRVREIVERRLKRHGIDASPDKFFPPDKKQEGRIHAIEQRIRDSWEREGHGYRPSDDATRYARPQYIASLKGTRKQGSKYRYAGFYTLVNISSGLVRYFLEDAAKMYSMEQAKSKSGAPVEYIRPETQDQIVRSAAQSLINEEFERVFLEETDQAADDSERERLRVEQIHLHNLLKGLGGLFHLKLISEDSERRVFSVALSDSPPEELRSLLRRGVHMGYLQESTIGNKEGTGRVPLYVLTRRLAPYFTLDPSGFAGYQFMTSESLMALTKDPNAVLKRLSDARTKEGEMDKVLGQSGQLKLFD